MIDASQWSGRRGLLACRVGHRFISFADPPLLRIGRLKQIGSVVGLAFVLFGGICKASTPWMTWFRRQCGRVQVREFKTEFATRSTSVSAGRSARSGEPIISGRRQPSDRWQEPFAR